MIQETLINQSREVVMQNPCINCPGLCCSQNLINVCGYDVWVIVRELQVHPSDFVGLICLETGSRYSFRIDSSDKAYGIVLNMKEWSGDGSRCIFALDLPNDVVRCGIYSIRPVPCRIYPMVFKGDTVVKNPSSLCSAGTWDVSKRDLSYHKEELMRSDMEYSIYSFLLDIWNREMLKRSKLDKADFKPFFTFLLEVYKQLDVARVMVPGEDWASIWKQWYQFTVCETNPLSCRTALTKGTTSWRRWLRSIREITLQLKPDSGFPTPGRERQC